MYRRKAKNPALSLYAGESLMSLAGEALTLLKTVSNKMGFKVKGRISGKKQRILTTANRLRDIAESIAHIIKLAIDVREKTEKCYDFEGEKACNICTNWWLHERADEIAIKRLKYMTIIRYLKEGSAEFQVGKSKLRISAEKYTICYENLCIEVPVGNMEVLESKIDEVILMLRKVEGEVHNAAQALEKCLKSMRIIT